MTEAKNALFVKNHWRRNVENIEAQPPALEPVFPLAKFSACAGWGRR